MLDVVVTYQTMPADLLGLLLLNQNQQALRRPPLPYLLAVNFLAVKETSKYHNIRNVSDKINVFYSKQMIIKVTDLLLLLGYFFLTREKNPSFHWYHIYTLIFTAYFIFINMHRTQIFAYFVVIKMVHKVRGWMKKETWQNLKALFYKKFCIDP